MFDLNIFALVKENLYLEIKQILRQFVYLYRVSEMQNKSGKSSCPPPQGVVLRGLHLHLRDRRAGADHGAAPPPRPRPPRRRPRPRHGRHHPHHRPRQVQLTVLGKQSPGAVESQTFRMFFVLFFVLFLGCAQEEVEEGEWGGCGEHAGGGGGGGEQGDGGGGLRGDLGLQARHPGGPVGVRSPSPGG